MLWHSKLLSLSALTLACLFTTSAFANDTTEYLVKDLTTSNVDLDQYWTPERMKNAKPFPLPKIYKRAAKNIPNDVDPKDIVSGEGAPPTVKVDLDTKPLFKPVNHPVPPASNDVGTSGEQFSSSRIVPITADTAYPYSTVGKLFFTIPGQGDFVCSASVLRPRVLLTAGHCMHKGSGGAGGFYTNWRFVPSFRNGAAPFQTWTPRYVGVTGTWASGGGVVPNAADYGMMEMFDRNISGVVRKLGSVTGFLGFQTLRLRPNHAHLLGYPCNLDSCNMMHQVTAQSSNVVVNNTVEYGSDMSNGSSGGPWVQNFGNLAVGQTGGLNPGLNRVIGVTSFVYISPNPKAEGSSIPDNRFVTLLNVICGHQAGNC